MKKYLNALKTSYKLITDNWKTWLLFLFFYNAVSFTLYYAVTSVLYTVALKSAGITYIAPNTLVTFFLCPVTWVYIVVSLLLSMFLIVLELGSLYKMYDASRLGEKIGLYSILRHGIKVSWRSLNRKNLLLGLYLLFMLPILGISMFSNMSYSIVIPGALITALEKVKFVYLLLCAALLALLFYTCRLQYSVVAFSLDDCSFKEAVAKSKRMIKGKFVYTILPVILNYIVMSVVFFGAGALCGILLSGVFKTNIDQAAYIGGMFGYVWVCVLGPSVLLAQIAALYFELAGEKGEHLPEKSTVTEEKKSQKKGKIATAAVLVVCLSITAVYYAQDTTPDIVKLDVPEIAAHRGDSGNAPENTMPAFELAVKDGCCDWIELDVHQTKDGVIVITHDDSLLMIDGSNRCVHELTYDELLQVDFGSREGVSAEYAGTKIATLNEVLDYCKGKIKLQIEIKPTAYDNHIEEAVIEIIRNHDMVDSCVILSMNTNTLRRIKELDSEITTMYCMQIASGEITDIDFAEYISIEEQNLTPELVNSMHAQNRKCFVWTINSTDNIQYLVDCGADVILTDYPVDIYNALKDADYSGGIARTLRLFINSD